MAIMGSEIFTQFTRGLLCPGPSKGSGDGVKQGSRTTIGDCGWQRTTGDFLLEVERELLGPFAPERILQASRGLKSQFRERLQTDPACMLPSYNHKLATGKEKGTYAALDLGGSTFRVAIVDLMANMDDSEEPRSRFVEMKAFHVGKEVKDLIGTAFFDWMAARIVETLGEKQDSLTSGGLDSFPLALTWSFPVEQTSPSSGRLQAMGKAFRAADTLMGEDLGSLVEAACLRAGFAAKIHILLNDSSATLISQTYTHPSTRFGLILGTGINMAGYLPLSLIGKGKLGERPQQWLAEARSVVVNAELSMFGHGVLPQTRWDAALSYALPRPDFQPLETMVSGMYLGEILRLVLVEAIETTGLFEGVVPKAFRKPYSLKTEMLSLIESNVFLDLEKAVGSSSPLTGRNRTFLRSICAIISRRSAAITSVAVHAFWDLRREALQSVAASAQRGEKEAVQAEADLEETVVACTGSVIENYPGYSEMCQTYVDDLVAQSVGDREEVVGKITFIPAQQSSLLGAGVALGATMEDRS